jgi:hypothetical protein
MSMLVICVVTPRELEGFGVGWGTYCLQLCVDKTQNTNICLMNLKCQLLIRN